MIDLYPHQEIAINKLNNGQILCGDTGSGKSIAAIAYYIRKECNGDFPSNTSSYKRMATPKQLYIITTAKKRDSLEWEKECAKFAMTNVTIDSWNNIKKYLDVKNAFFIFDEQRVIGYGAWSKTFIKITKKNRWILLSATPGDTWSDYIPVFIANGFYKNKTEFERRHIVYNPFTTFKKIDRYLETGTLIKYRNQILINMRFERNTISHNYYKYSEYNELLYETVFKQRWNPYDNKPIENASQLFYLMRKVVNSHENRIDIIRNTIREHPKIIVFYNFNYELDILLKFGESIGIKTTQLNGHKHEEIPKTKLWMHCVQYMAGSEAWNCVETDTMIFYSQNYSYRTIHQAKGRINRLNTPFTDLYYYHIVSRAPIDIAISNAIKKKKVFNEKKFLENSNAKKTFPIIEEKEITFD